MKKILLPLLILSMMFVASACEKSAGSDLIQKDSEVKKAVDGWVVYTNPAYRYELRFPQDWTFKDSGEDGKTSEFFPKNSASQLVIKSYSNWAENYSLDQFYEKRTETFYKDMAKEDVKIGNQDAKLIRGVKGRLEDKEKTIDLIVLDLKDRIMEIELRDSNDTSKAVMSSIKFYGNATVTPQQ